LQRASRNLSTSKRSRERSRGGPGSSTPTTAELVVHLQKNRDADVAADDRVHEQSLKMADMLSDGIIRQFPAKLT
jgi:hypothetical protein